MLNTFILPACANQTLGKALSNHQQCPAAPRLASFACRLAGRNKDSAYIADKLAQRYRSFTDTVQFPIDGPLFPPAGDSAAPVVITVYISIICPRCKQVCSFLYDSVTAGSLKGKARLQVKLLTVDNRDMALLAADEQGVFWSYFRKCAAGGRRLDLPVLYAVAREMLLDMKKFKRAINDKKLHERALASRREAHANGVEFTPALFLNGYCYYSSDHPMWIVDAVEYEYRRTVAGRGQR